MGVSVSRGVTEQLVVNKIEGVGEGCDLQRSSGRGGGRSRRVVHQREQAAVSKILFNLRREKTLWIERCRSCKVGDDVCWKREGQLCWSRTLSSCGRSARLWRRRAGRRKAGFAIDNRRGRRLRRRRIDGRLGGFEVGCWRGGRARRRRITGGINRDEMGSLSNLF
jgi:hypothetical protein